MGRRQLHIHRLVGPQRYGPLLQAQVRLRDARIAGDVADTVLLLEHAPVITLGRSASDENVLVDPDTLRARGVDVFDIGRGGDVTYHGPGQLVAYPILDLQPDRKDVRRYVSNLEEVMVRVCGRYGLPAGREAGLNGAWIDDRKVGAVGVRIRKWVTMHGLALNVATELSAFDLIVPCGIRDRGVTSLSRELSRPVALDEAMQHMAAVFGEVFESDVALFDGLPREAGDGAEPDA